LRRPTFLFLFICLGAWAAGAGVDLPVALPEEIDMPEQSQIEITYNESDVYWQEKIAVFRGNANIIYQDISISADEIIFDFENLRAEASRNVILWFAGTQWFGEYVVIDLRERRVGFSKSHLDGHWYFLDSDSLEILENGQRIIGRGSEFTTCDLPDPHYRFVLDKIIIDPGRRFWMYNAWLKIGKVPVAYLPFFSRSLDPVDPTWIFVPGRGKKKGAYALNKIAWTFNKYMHTRLYLDYYEKLGPAIGFKNRYNEENKDHLDGFFYSRYLFGHDHNDFIQEPPEYAYEVEADRWKLAGQHWQTFGERTTLTSRYYTLSDREYNEDFELEQELRGLPEEMIEYERNSFVNLAHRGEHYNYRLTAKARTNNVYFNEFPEDERLPQIHVDGLRRELLGLPLYFKTSADFTRYRSDQEVIQGLRSANVARFFQEADRGNFDLELSYPLSLPWGLRAIPLVGYQWTHYSDPFREYRFKDRDRIAPNQTALLREEFEDQTRHVGRAGIELVDRFVWMWDTPGSRQFDRMRFVTEPRLSYLYRDPSVDFDKEGPESVFFTASDPGVTPGNFPMLDRFAQEGFLAQPFDMHDLPRRTESVLRLHLDSKFEAKRPGGGMTRFFNHSFEVAYDFEAEDHWTDLISELRVAPDYWLSFYNFVNYDLDESELRQSNTSVRVQPHSRVVANVGLSTYDLGFNSNQQEDLYWDISYQLSDKYSLLFRQHWDLDEGQFRENRFEITRDLHDAVASLIIREKDYVDEDDEFEIQFRFLIKFAATGEVVGGRR
jgi:lipopolysaccharide assembly outer membrane protein LptD (OstA)